ncbi:MAG TPA: hypothetical protein G4O16_01090 [Dehalococcoidia bacterium]|nr:hypothetical protein [Dehalococcoidia bacterium]
MARLGEARWLAVIAGAVVGIALMLILGAAFSSTLEDADTIGEVLGIVFGVAAVSYFLTGFVAGVWTRETKYGMYAALVLLIANIIYNIATGYVGTIVSIIIAIIFAVVCGSLGGWIGKLARH